jgi:hypothetical protein
MYTDYYLHQSGNGMPVFQGYRGQMGHGLGSILSGWFRSAMPLIKRGLAFLGGHALRTGAKIADDVADGQNFVEASKKRAKETINSIVPSFVNQSGSGMRRKRTRAKKKSKRVKRDIFS